LTLRMIEPLREMSVWREFHLPANVQVVARAFVYHRHFH
jgi:hypothetical protein